MKILVVEDEPELLDLFAFKLKRNGYSVLTADSGNRAYDLFTENRNEIEIVVTDIRMPNGSGISLAKKIESISNVKILFVSANINFSKEDQGVLDRNHFLCKTEACKDLVATVKQILNS